ncbi:MAG: acetylxylan esterase, partial [Planctomycetaceae bacterium]|nr:acetylxylan esterase [Planctomycetaceae bacterium]
MLLPCASFGQTDTSRGEKMIAEYFRQETAKLTRQSLAEIQTQADWEKQKPIYRKQLQEMLGLDPFPARTPLKPVITGTVEAEDFLVDKVQFQSRPGLYVTGNFYYPKNAKGKLPTILYVCGHGRVVKNGVSYGNKATYQHHGAWFARNGYTCLTIDTVQLGEIEGIHHGTYRYGMWWWNARGYSSAGVEAWNCIRALDYLETRPEVDADRIGVTGRSGGGAYSWWIAALDERIKVAVPVAGITSLYNHVVDGCVEGHCDCMFQVNTYRWDYANVAALVAPRPLLISNTDKDRIFPLNGVVSVYFKTRRIYQLLGAGDKLGLQITEGPHKDTQNLRIHAFHWFNEYLKGERPSPLIEMAATKFFEPEQLRVFPPGEEPKDQINTTIQETFVPKADPPPVPQSKDEWNKQKTAWLEQLQTKSFRGWPTEEFPSGEKLDLKEVFSVANEGVQFSAYDFTSQNAIQLRLYLAHRKGLKPQDLDLAVLNVLDQEGWKEFVSTMRAGFPKQFEGEIAVDKNQAEFEQTQKMFQSFPWAMAYVAPRGVGPTAWKDNERYQTHIRRRFMLLGQTWHGQQVWDARRAVQALRQVEGMDSVQLWLQGERDMAG